MKEEDFWKYLDDNEFYLVWINEYKQIPTEKNTAVMDARYDVSNKLWIKY
jgi:hypothetical protein